jgi:hypothetical protein
MKSNTIYTIFILSIAYLAMACSNKKVAVITHYKDLIPLDQQEVTISGIYIQYDPVPHVKRDTIDYLSGILLEGDTVPRVFLEKPRPLYELKNFNGKKVVVSGRYFKTMPLAKGDPPYTARYQGGWIHEINKIEPIEK